MIRAKPWIVGLQMGLLAIIACDGTQENPPAETPSANEEIETTEVTEFRHDAPCPAWLGQCTNQGCNGTPLPPPHNQVGSNFENRDMNGDWSRTNFHGARLDSSRWAAGSNLSESNFHGADLGHAILSGVDLWGSCLHGADLSHADLSYADLRCICAHGADFRGANLYGAQWYGANTHGARF
jgi:hypothetical protein